MAQFHRHRQLYPQQENSLHHQLDCLLSVVKDVVSFIKFSKYVASNYEVGTGWGNIFEYANELLAKFIEHESLKTIKDLKGYLEKTGNKIFLED